ncbi:uncharacterized protein PAC_03597 [Phialocephala subalpina]|uniref:ribonuclease H n=1 Tax=Phialocephala subalpina TaxID=576137 RepID=A0A1L7WLS2_9HELO|nr:uncharacterized protein PAC_03597 [Phialocephala subalpina]
MTLGTVIRSDQVAIQDVCAQVEAALHAAITMIVARPDFHQQLIRLLEESEEEAAMEERERRIYKHKNKRCWEDWEGQVRRLCRDSSIIVLNIDGACSKNGRDGAEASYGLYFGDDLDHNRCDFLPERYKQTSQAAELYAAKMALMIVAGSWETDEDEEEQVDFEGVLAISDSAYLVDGITNWVWTWAENGWLNSAGETVANVGLWRWLHKNILKLQAMGLEVRFIYVRREYNQEADELAKSVLYE